MKAPAAVVVTVGEELLRGEITDSNSAWLGRELSAMGLQVRAGLTVADREDDIVEALQRAVDIAPLVIVTGGLGPTGDDLTAAAAAKFAGVELVRSAAAAENIARRLQCPVSEVTGSRLRMAMIPKGAEVYPNPEGAAPGVHINCRLKTEGRGPRFVEATQGPQPAVLRHLFFVPGVPREMKAIFKESLVPVIGGLFSDRPLSRTRLLHVSGWPESEADRAARETLGDMLDLGAITLGTRIGPGWVSLRLNAEGAPAADNIDRATGLLLEHFGNDIWGRDDQTLEEVTAEALTGRKLTLALAESCTGGMITARLVSVPGISAALLQGLVTYSNRAKQELLGVDSGIIDRCGAVSRECAEAMANGLRTKYGADINLAVTGIAGPEGGSPGKPVGTVHFALAGPGGLQHEVIRFSGSREWVRQRAASRGLWLIRRAALEARAD